MKQTAAQLSANNDAVKAAQEKIKALTGGSRLRRSVVKRQAAASCGAVIILVKQLTTYIKQAPTSPKIKVDMQEVIKSLYILVLLGCSSSNFNHHSNMLSRGSNIPEGGIFYS